MADIVEKNKTKQKHVKISVAEKFESHLTKTKQKTTVLALQCVRIWNGLQGFLVDCSERSSKEPLFCNLMVLNVAKAITGTTYRA